MAFRVIAQSLRNVFTIHFTIQVDTSPDVFLVNWGVMILLTVVGMSCFNVLLFFMFASLQCCRLLVRRNQHQSRRQSEILLHLEQSQPPQLRHL